MLSDANGGQEMTMDDDNRLKEQNNRYVTALEMIAEELGLGTVDPTDCIAAIKSLKAGINPTDDTGVSEDQFMYWSVQLGSGDTSETDDEILARTKFNRWKANFPEDRVELFKFYVRSVDGQNLDVEYDVNGRRVSNETLIAKP